MKKITFTFYLLLSVFGLNAQNETDSAIDFPDISYPSINDTETKIEEVFQKHELNLIVFWAPNGYSVRQLKEIEEDYGDWKEKFDIQIIIVSMGMDLVRAKSTVKRYEGKMDCVIFLDEYIIKKGEKTTLKYSKSIPGFNGTSPSSMLVSKDGNIVASLWGYQSQNKISDAISNYFNQ